MKLLYVHLLIKLLLDRFKKARENLFYFILFFDKEEKISQRKQQINTQINWHLYNL